MEDYNKVILMGTIVSDFSQGNNGSCDFQVEYVKGEYKNIFNVKAFGGTASMVQKFFTNGKRIMIEGSLADGFIVAQMCTFVDSKQ